MVLWQNEKMESDDFKGIYKASDVNSVPGSGHVKHGNDFFYVNFAGISKEVEEFSPLKVAGILRAWTQGSNMVAEDTEECLEIDNLGMKGFMWMPSV